MPQTYTNPKNDRRSFTHTGSEVGADNVNREVNETGREDTIIEWTCPRKFDSVTYSAGDHVTKFYPRTREEFDGDGSQTTFSPAAVIDPPSGETDLDDMEYPPVVAYDTAAGAELEVESYDFNANEVTFASAPDSGTANVILWSIITEGEVKYLGVDQFNNTVSALDTWGIPIHVFNDFEQGKNMTRIHLTGAATFEETETLRLTLESPHKIAWEDAEYPHGQYASTIEQRVDVTV